jgi:hypothetical protein
MLGGGRDRVEVRGWTPVHVQGLSKRGGPFLFKPPSNSIYLESCCSSPLIRGFYFTVIIRYGRYISARSGRLIILAYS